MAQKKRATSTKRSVTPSKTKTIKRTPARAATRKSPSAVKRTTSAVKKRPIVKKIRAIKPAHKKLALALLILGLIAGIGILFSLKITTSDATTGIIQNKRGGCLDNHDSRTTNGNPIDYWRCNGTGAQKWIASAGRIMNSNGKCLDVPGGSTRVGTNLQLYTCNGSYNSQQWTVTSSHTIVNKHSHLCIDDTGGHTTNGNPVQMFTCNGSASQVWYIGGISSGSGGGSKQSMARAIIGSSKAHFLSGAKDALAKIASGASNGNSTPCGMNIHVLNVLTELLAHHSSVGISDNNALCYGNNSGRSAGSRHWDGNGSALDIYELDGVAFDFSNSSQINKAVSYINEIKGMLVKGSSLHSSSQVGQVECSGFGMGISGVIRFDDSCNHVHIDFPPWSDSNLKYLSGAW